MKTNKINIRFGIITLIILAAAFSRLIPHPWDFTAVGATALFGAAYFSNRFVAFVVPLFAMWLSDIVMNNTVYASFHGNKLWLFPETFPWYYAGFALVTLVGFGLLKKVKFSSVIGAGISASLVFFLVSNFGVWLGNAAYPQNVSGLVACYTAGIPFFWNTVAGDLFYCGVLFGVFELAKMKFPVLQTQRA
jgi:hypothetical protein